jgi:hypothetical protein
LPNLEFKEQFQAPKFNEMSKEYQRKIKAVAPRDPLGAHIQIPRGVAIQGEEAIEMWRADKDYSHIISHKNGGWKTRLNCLWENFRTNRARGAVNMTPREIRGIKWQNLIDDLTGRVQVTTRYATKATLKSIPTEVSFSVLRNVTAYEDGQITLSQMLLNTAKDAGQYAIVTYGWQAGVATIAIAFPELGITTELAYTAYNYATIAANVVPTVASFVQDFYKGYIHLDQIIGKQLPHLRQIQHQAI